MSDNKDLFDNNITVSLDKTGKFILPSETPEIKKIKDFLGDLQKSLFGQQDEAELQKVREEKIQYPFVCEDCNKKMTKDEIGGQCCDHHTHEVLNRNGGYLCKKHYQRALENGGKCDQCCWWEVT